MKKKFLPWIAAAAIAIICVCLLPTRAQAASASDLTFELNSDGKSYSVTDCYWLASGELVIPSTYNNKPVTTIGDVAFNSCYDLTSITIPDSVTSIGDSAFARCVSLTSITIPNSVTSIGDSAFDDCDGLQYNVYNNAKYLGNSKNPYVYLAKANSTSITSCNIHSATKFIGNSAFYDCDDLTSVTIGNNVTSIGSYAFAWCDSLTSITIPDSVTAIGNSAFYCCYDLTNVTIGNSVTTIGWSAFEDCDSLTSITIPDSVTSIGDRAFSGCSNLQYNVYNNAKYLGNSSNPYVYLAEANATSITSCNIHSATKFIGDYAFSSCDRLTSITIPDSVTTIGSCAFYNCDSLTSITIPDSVTEIGWYAFYGCHSLTSITIPDSVTSIGNYAFSYCDSLTSVSIGNSVTTIGNEAFYDCDSLTSITIPDSVTSIGNYAFYGCDDLTSITIPDSVTSIGDSAFEYCDSLQYNVYNNAKYLGNSKNPYVYLAKANSHFITSCNIHSATKLIGRSAFKYCDRLTSITIPNSVTSIGDYAFKYCGRLTSITIPDSVTSIGDSAFENCWIEELIIAEGSKTVAHTMVIHTAGVKKIVIPNSVTSIGDYAFYGCDGLTSITIPNSVTSIGDSAFKYCDGLTSITIPNSVTSIGRFAFEYCDSLTSITIPDSVTTIDYYAFKDCVNLTQIVLPKGITIGAEAFSGTALQKVYHKGNPTDWYQIMQSGNGNLTNATIFHNFGGFATIKTQPKSVTVADGEMAKTSVVATGDGLTYQWYYKNEGATKFSKSTSTKNSYSAKMNGSYYTRWVYCVITDKYGNSVQTDTVALEAKLSAPAVTVSKNSYNSLNVTWSKVNGAQFYELYRSTNSTSGFVKLGTYNAETFNKISGSLTTGTEYFYKVRAYRVVDGVKKYSDYSTVKSAAPKLATPTVSVAKDSYNSLNVTWNKVTGAQFYELYRSTNSTSGFTKLGTYTAETLSKVSGSLATGTEYFYKVRAYVVVNGVKVYSDYSAVKSGTPKLATPTISVAKDSYNSLNVTWNKVTGAQFYELYRSTNSTSGFTKLGTYTAATLSKISGSLATGTEYFYKVRAYVVVNGVKVYSDYSAVKSGTPKLATPTISVTKNTYNSLNVTWNKVTGAQFYELYRSTNSTSGFTKLGVYTAETFSKISGSLSTGTEYFYKVRAYRVVNGVKIYSDYSAVKSGTPTLTATTGVKATTGTTKGTVTVSWSKTTGATFYQVYRREVGSSTWSLLGTYNSSAVSMTSKQLTSGKTYEYRVRSYCVVGGVRQYSDWSSTVSAKAK